MTRVKVDLGYTKEELAALIPFNRAQISVTATRLARAEQDVAYYAACMAGLHAEAARLERIKQMMEADNA